MSEQEKTRILLVDDNVVIRQILRGVIRHDERLAVVGDAAGGETALQLLDTLKADLVCLDVNMPGLHGLTVLRLIRDKHPSVRVIVVSGESTSNTVSRAMKIGASGFVVKPFNADKVLRAIHNALHSPIPFVDPAVLEEMDAQDALAKAEAAKTGTPAEPAAAAEGETAAKSAGSAAADDEPAKGADPKK